MRSMTNGTYPALIDVTGVRGRGRERALDLEAFVRGRRGRGGHCGRVGCGRGVPWGWQHRGRGEETRVGETTVRTRGWARVRTRRVRRGLLGGGRGRWTRLGDVGGSGRGTAVDMMMLGGDWASIYTRRHARPVHSGRTGCGRRWVGSCAGRRWEGDEKRSGRQKRKNKGRAPNLSTSTRICTKSHQSHNNFTAVKCTTPQDGNPSLIISGPSFFARRPNGAAPRALPLWPASRPGCVAIGMRSAWDSAMDVQGGQAHLLRCLRWLPTMAARDGCPCTDPSGRQPDFVSGSDELRPGILARTSHQPSALRSLISSHSVRTRARARRRAGPQGRSDKV